MTAHEVADRLVAGWLSELPPHVVDAAVMLRQQAHQIATYNAALVELQDHYKARGKTLQAHIIHNARQKLKRALK